MDLNVRTLFNGCIHGNSFYASIIVIICIAKTLYQKFETNIPRNKTARPHSQFLQSVSVFYIPRIGLLFCCSQIGRRVLGIYKSLTDP
jgi:hypothetical protein